MCRGHTGAIVQLDFSEDSRYLQSNCLANEELLYWGNRGNVVKASSLDDVAWQSWSCTYGLQTKGVHGHNGATVATASSRGSFQRPRPGWVDFSPVARSPLAMDEAACLVGGKFDGRLCLYRYPCTEVEVAMEKQYPAHGGPIAFLSFTRVEEAGAREGLDDDGVESKRKEAARGESLRASAVLYTGGVRDRCLFKWTLEDGARYKEADLLTEDSFMQYSRLKMRSRHAGGEPLQNKLSVLGAESSKLLMSTELELEWVHGYSGHSGSNNLHFTSVGGFVYPAAQIGIVQQKGSQSFFTKHDGDISCCCMHPSKKIVATGEIAKNRPCIFVWSTTDFHSVMLVGAHTVGISLLAFSKEGSLLASCGLDKDNTIAVHDWERNVLIAKTSNQFQSLGCAFSASGAIVTCGVSFVTLWELEGGNLVWQPGEYEVLSTARTFLCVAAPHFVADDASAAGAARVGDDKTTSQILDLVVTGDALGDVMVWRGRKCIAQEKAHASAIQVIATFAEGFATGDMSGTISVWSNTYPLKKRMTFASGCDIRGISVSSQEKKILVGTRDRSIFEIDMMAQKYEKVAVVSGHSDEIWGLAPHPTRNEYFTSSDDKTLRHWDAVEMEEIRRANLSAGARAVAVHPSGGFVAVGLITGDLVFLDKDLKEIKGLSDETGKDKAAAAKKCVTRLKYSDSGKALVAISVDFGVRIFKVEVESAGHTFVGATNIGSDRGEDGRDTSAIHLDGTLSCVDFDSTETMIRLVDSLGRSCFVDVSSGTILPQKEVATRKPLWGSRRADLPPVCKAIFDVGGGGGGGGGGGRSGGAGAGVATVAAITTAQGETKGENDADDQGGAVGSLAPASLALLVARTDETGHIGISMHHSAGGPVSRLSHIKFYPGHTEDGVSDLRFLSSGKHLISAGSMDSCVMQWRVLHRPESVGGVGDGSGRGGANAVGSKPRRGAVAGGSSGWKEPSHQRFAQQDLMRLHQRLRYGLSSPEPTSKLHKNRKMWKRLDLEWSFGLSCSSSSTPVRYVNDGTDLTWSTSGVGVVYRYVLSLLCFLSRGSLFSNISPYPPPPPPQPNPSRYALLVAPRKHRHVQRGAPQPFYCCNGKLRTEPKACGLGRRNVFGDRDHGGILRRRHCLRRVFKHWEIPRCRRCAEQRSGL